MGTARGGCLAVTRVRIGPGLSPTVMCLGMEWDGMRVGRDRGWGWDRKGTRDETGQEPGWCKGWGWG